MTMNAKKNTPVKAATHKDPMDLLDRESYARVSMLVGQIVEVLRGAALKCDANAIWVIPANFREGSFDFIGSGLNIPLTTE
jgi:hypothetical protein